jgi:hypothetical protein
MDILITDVTEMKANYCVAGWDAIEGQMIRPLPGGFHWTGHLLAAHGVRPGATIRVVITGGQPNSVYPHRTEDTPIDAAKIGLVRKGPSPWFGVNAPPVTESLAAAFGQQIQTTRVWNGARKGAFVQEGAQIASLAALQVERSNLQFFEDTFEGERSLRAYVTDALYRYNLPVVAKNLRELYRANGPSAVNQHLPNAGELHVRVGLARAWDGQPGKCTVPCAAFILSQKLSLR